VPDIFFRALSIEKLRMTFTTRYYISQAIRERAGYIAAEAGVTVANKAVAGDSESISVSGLLLRRREEVLKNINRPEKRESLFLSLVPSPFLSRRAFLVPRNKLFPRPRYHLSG